MTFEFVCDWREVMKEGPPLGEGLEAAEEAKPARVVQGQQSVQEHAPEQLAENGHRHHAGPGHDGRARQLPKGDPDRTRQSCATSDQSLSQQPD